MKILRSSAHPRGWKIVIEGRDVSFIYLKPDGEVEFVGTVPEYRRMGLASRLWAYLVENGQAPQHSPCRLPEGNLWALSVGGALPPPHALPCLLCDAV